MKTETDRLRDTAWRAFEAQDAMRSLTAADELLKRDASDVDAMFIAGTSLYRAGQEGLAALVLNSARCATQDKTKLGSILNNIGCAVQDYNPQDAYTLFRKSLEYGDPPPTTYDNLCNVASKIGRHAEALDWAAKSQGWDTSHNRSFALMQLGRWAEAWACYSKTAGASVRPETVGRTYGLPRWDGKAEGRVILHGEQGVGDEVLFMSMCPRDFDGVIDCNHRTAGLFRRSFPKAAVFGTLTQSYVEWPFEHPCDWHLEMGGLGEYFAPQPFRGGAFLKPDPARVAACRAWLKAADESARPFVGIGWTGGTWTTGRAERTLPFEIVKKLILAHPEVNWVCLEYEDRDEELAELPGVLDPKWATRKGADLDELAALLAALDLTITATNSTVDVAGAIGAPCWALVDEQPQWRYAPAAGEHQMWFYDSVRTFRQKPHDAGDWDSVIARVGLALDGFRGPAA